MNHAHQWPPPAMDDLPRDGWHWSDFSRPVAEFGHVLFDTNAVECTGNSWTFWEKPWQWDNAHALWEKLGKPRRGDDMWMRFVHAVDTHTEAEALTALDNTGALPPLWWENDAEWATFTKMLLAAGHSYLSGYVNPRTSTQRDVFRWTFDRAHRDWVALGRPERSKRGWAEFVIKWRMPEPGCDGR